ncbi:BTB/POZ domain-containing protein 19-like [Sitodiplosis mosellana]|uniref:BTB/POZ domain-containing protein 19-like n=1 Tax=Sitodiplosis mosellana TaxID=263140 RepID=UPI0024452BF8|nr:BTB/POZ domain-containing protein 19-like [Sitodiplosis mosellana]
MSDNKSVLLQTIQSSYLNPDGADVWFVFDGDRVPGHKFLLTGLSPWLNITFNSSLPETGNVDMTNSQVTVAAFKEFLQFFYMDDVTLTMENIEGVIHFAKQSLSKDVFTKCEQFLIKSFTMDKIFYGHQLALLYEADALKAFCEDEICVNAEATFKSSSFLDFPYSMLLTILKFDSLVCEEKDIFDACIAWAKAACDRNQKDSKILENLRAQLDDLIYQIRFSSMTVDKATECIRSCRGLFTAAEMEEIMCMVNRKLDFIEKKFNWTPRYYNPKSGRGNQLLCSRYSSSDKTNDEYNPRGSEKITFTCNRRVVLNGFYYECSGFDGESFTVTITEAKSENVTERYNQEVTFDYGSGLELTMIL